MPGRGGFSVRRTRQMPDMSKRWLLDSLTRNWSPPTNALPAKIAAIAQASYRFYADGTESGSVALAAQDTAYPATLTADTPLLVRTRLQTDSVAVPFTDDFQLQYGKNIGSTYILESGITGSNVETPHRSAFNLAVSQSVVVIAYIAADDWTPSSQNVFTGIWALNAADGMFRCGIAATGTMTMSVSVGGVGGTASTTTVLQSLSAVPDGAGQWVWCMWQADDGTTDFKYSTDPLSTALGSITWTNVQINRASSTTGILTTSTAPLRVGGYDTNGNLLPFAGKVYRSWVGTGAATGISSFAAATELADFNANNWTGGSTIVSGAANDVWTVNTGATAVQPGTWWNVTNGTEALLDTYPQPNVDSGASMGNATFQSSQAQSFLGDGKRLSTARFWVNTQGSPTGTVTAQLFAHSGTFGASGSVPTGAALSTSATVAAASIGGVGSWISFTFTNAAVLTSGTPYFISVGYDLFNDTSNFIQAGYDNSASTHAGAMAQLVFGAWSSLSTADLVFEVYTTPPNEVIPFASTNLVDGAATTNRLGAGSGSFVAGEVSETGLASDVGWSANNYTEVLYSVTVKRAVLVTNDELRFRVNRNGVASLTYTTTPTVTVTIGAATTQATIATTFVFTATATALPTHEATIATTFAFTATATAIPTVVVPAASIRLHGLGTEYLSTPGAPALDIVGDIEIVARVALDNWNDASTLPAIIAKADRSLQSSYVFAAYYNFRFQWSVTGSAQLSNDSSAHFISDYAVSWVKVTVDVDNGAAGKTFRFYKANDQAEEPTSWTQVGTDNVVAGTTSIFAGTAPLVIGVSGAGLFPSQFAPMIIHRAIIRNGIGGTTVADFDARDYVTGTTLVSRATGETWTLNGSPTPLATGAPANFTFTATATAARLVAATIATTFAFTATATAGVTQQPTIATTFPFTATAAAGVTQQPTIATTFAFTATSTAIDVHAATIATAFTWATTATAVPQPEAVIATTYSFSTTAAAGVTQQPTIATTFAFTATATAIPLHLATIATTFAFAATSTTDVIHPATIATTFTFTTTATALPQVEDTIATTFLFTTTATAIPLHPATIATTFTFTATAAAAVPGSFIPTDISGCQLWLDASQLSGANGSAVSPWSDLSGAAHDGVIVGSPAPVVHANGLDSKKVVRFAASQGGVRISSTGVSNDFTLVYVGQIVSGGTTGRVIAGIYPPNNLLVGFWNGFEDVMYDNGFASPNTQTAVTNNWKMYSADGAFGTGGFDPLHTDRFFANGVLMGTIAPPTPQGWGGTFAINGYDPSTSAETCDCEVAEVCFYDHKLSDAERIQVENYLRLKWLRVQATVATTFTFSATSTADVVHPATISTTFTFTATAAAALIQQATIATSFTFSAVSTAVVTHPATIATTFTWTATATAVPTHEATIATAFSFTATAAAIPIHPATIATTFTFTATATAVNNRAATIATAFTFAATSTALAQHEASVATTFTFTTTSIATPSHPATISDTYVWTATPTAVVTHPATIATTYSFTTTASAVAFGPGAATIITVFDFLTTVTAFTTRAATAAGPFTFSTTATAVPIHPATIADTYSFVTTASALVTHPATIASTFTFSATADAARVAVASIATTFTFAATATALTSQSAAITTQFTFTTTSAATTLHLAIITSEFSFTATATATPFVPATITTTYAFTTSSTATAIIPAAILTTFLFFAGATATFGGVMINDADALFLNGLSASAVYAGAVKVWP